MPMFQKITRGGGLMVKPKRQPKFYTAIFHNSKIMDTTRYGEAGHEVHGRPAGTVIMTVAVELDGTLLPHTQRWSVV